MRTSAFWLDAAERAVRTFAQALVAVLVAGFVFTDALKGVPGNWTFEALDAWLKSPREYAPGTKMTFAGLGKVEDRANLIAYLETQK